MACPMGGFEPIEESPIEVILEDPQKHFPRFLLGSDLLSTLELLSDLILHSAEGHHVAIECLWCWQDLAEAPHSLSPVADVLAEADCDKVASAALHLLSRLLKFAPNPVARVRIRHELNELRMREITGAVSAKFAWSPEFREAEREWNLNLREAEQHRLQTPPSAGGQCSKLAVAQQDADSGTFSSEEDDFAMDGLGASRECSPPSIITADGLAEELGRLPAFQHIPTNALKLMSGILTRCLTILQRGGSEGTNELIETLQRLMNDFNATISTSMQPTAVAPPPAVAASTPPPPPPPNLLKRPTSSAAVSGLVRTGAPPPPPPPPSLLSPAKALLNGDSAAKSSIDGKLGSSSLRSTFPIPIHSLAAVEVPKALRPKAVPPEGKRLRHLQWTKVPADSALLRKGSANGSSGSVWQLLDKVDAELGGKLDFSQIDAHFSSVMLDPVSPRPALASSPSPSSSSASASSKQVTVSLVSSKRSLSVNIFLKMDKDGTGRALVENLKEGAYETIGLDRLKMLLQILPADEEQKLLRNYSGDFTALGQAEKFLVQLLAIPHYKWRIEAAVFRLEFPSVMADVTRDLQLLCKACKELKASGCLQKIFYCLLHMGNYLNHGAAVGNAVGFKLASLWKINEVRGMTFSRTLWHLLADQLNNCWEELESELSTIHSAAKLSFENLRGEVLAFQDRRNTLETALKRISGDAFLEQFAAFVQTAKEDLSLNLELLSSINTARRELAHYFCEAERTFSLEECIKIISTLVNHFRLASIENLQRAETVTKKVGDGDGESKTDYPPQSTKLSKFLLCSSGSSTVPRRPRHSISHQTGGDLLTVSAGDPSLQLERCKMRRASMFNENDRERSGSLLRVGEGVGDDLPKRRRRSSQLSSQQRLSANGDPLSNSDGGGADLKTSLESIVDTALNMVQGGKAGPRQCSNSTQMAGTGGEEIDKAGIGNSATNAHCSPVVVVATGNGDSRDGICPVDKVRERSAHLRGSLNSPSLTRQPSTTAAARRGSLYKVRTRQSTMQSPGEEKAPSSVLSQPSTTKSTMSDSLKPSMVRASERLGREARNAKAEQLASTHPSPTSSSTTSNKTVSPPREKRASGLVTAHPKLPTSSNIASPSSTKDCAPGSTKVQPTPSATTVSRGRRPAITNATQSSPGNGASPGISRTLSATRSIRGGAHNAFAQSGTNGARSAASTGMTPGRKTTAPSPPKSATERRHTLIRSESISTASRPSLIKTGSRDHQSGNRWV